VFLLNRSYTRADGKTPYELWLGKSPNLHFLRVFGCIAHVKSACVLIGYEPGSKAYKVFDLLAQRVHITRDVVFDEAGS
jgi:hypothetical protein